MDNRKPKRLSEKEKNDLLTFLDPDYDSSSDNETPNSDRVVEYINVTQCNSCKKKFAPHILTEPIDQCPFCGSFDISDLGEFQISDLGDDIDFA